MTAAALAQVRQLTGVLGGAERQAVRSVLGGAGSNVRRPDGRRRHAALVDADQDRDGGRPRQRLCASATSRSCASARLPRRRAMRRFAAAALASAATRARTVTIDLTRTRRRQRPAHAAHARRSAERAVQPDRVARTGGRTCPRRSDRDDAADARRHARSRCASNRWDDWSDPTARTSTARP